MQLGKSLQQVFPGCCPALASRCVAAITGAILRTPLWLTVAPESKLAATFGTGRADRRTPGVCFKGRQKPVRHAFASKRQGRCETIHTQPKYLPAQRSEAAFESTTILRRGVSLQQSGQSGEWDIPGADIGDPWNASSHFAPRRLRKPNGNLGTSTKRCNASSTNRAATSARFLP